MAHGGGDKCTFVVVSDTHNKHGHVALPPGDVLLHCGDLTQQGTLTEVAHFAAWWHAQPHAQKVVIAGTLAGAGGRCARRWNPSREEDPGPSWMGLSVRNC